MEPCKNFKINHPLFNGQPSYTCKGCENYLPVKNNDKFVLPNGRINCKHFKEA